MDKIIKKNRILKGVVVSDKMDKTVVVAVVHLIKHAKYKKYHKSTSKFKAHDEENEFHLGDKVLITETRPISKSKCWRVIGKV